ncbi:MAG: acyl-ACP--UDP-N-acetylglucosamine O-acyltransferase [Candidatus Omnitrophota bacterium]
MNIHVTAVIHPEAKLAADVTVGPCSIIGADVILGRGCWVGPHCVLEGHAKIGEDNRFYTGAVIGSIPQDLKYKGEPTFLEIGSHNNFREYVTVNTGTVEGGGVTRIGNNNHIMAYAHIAHDCVVEDGTIIANNGTLGGHVTIGQKAIVGGLAGIHQFVRVGRLSILGGCSKAVQDVIPFAAVDGHPARVYGLNAVGLRRSGVSTETQLDHKRAFRILFSGCAQKEALESIERECGTSAEVKELVAFVRQSKQGICTRARRAAGEASWND